MCIYHQGGAPNYFPNSFSGPAADPAAEWHADTVSGDVKRYSTKDDDNFSQVRSSRRICPSPGSLPHSPPPPQCRAFFRSVLNEEERQRLISNIAGQLRAAKPFIQKRAIHNFTLVDPAFGNGIQDHIEKLNARM